jgi:hypothetical protein
VDIPDTGRIRSIISFPELAGDALALFRAQADIVLDVPGFLLLVTFEYFHDPGRFFHNGIISHWRFRKKGLPPQIMAGARSAISGFSPGGRGRSPPTGAKTVLARRQPFYDRLRP